MVKAISERIELRDVDDVAPEIVAEAAAAALARLDALGVSPLQACLSQGRLEAMDDQGQLDAEEPAFAASFSYALVTFRICSSHLRVIATTGSMAA